MENVSTSVDSERRIATAQAHRVKVDSQGRPTSAPTTYHYDERGRLVDATPAPDDAA